MKFIDIADIRVKAGDGGLGMSHFRREKHVPTGGPDGGNGGDGGNVYVIADENVTTLLDFRYRRFYEAPSGGKGGTNNRYGRAGPDQYLKVPCGTIVNDVDENTQLAEVLAHGEKALIAKGGRGGGGNALFSNSRNQAPTKTVPPTPGESRHIRLELKLIADVAIIGCPNAGKSTLISVISAARPKVADYPFTTLEPSLGVVSYKDCEPFVVADVPGLIAGAHEGKGLGHDFLRHIQRTKMIVHLIDGSQDTVEAMVTDYEEILNELKLYNAELLNRPRITVLSKLDHLAHADSDQIEDAEPLADFKKFLQTKKVSFIEISSAQRKGLMELQEELIKNLYQEDENSEENKR